MDSSSRPIPGLADPRTVVETAVGAALGPDWTTAPTALGDNVFRVSQPGAAQLLSEAWEAVHRLRQQPGIAEVELDVLLPAPVEQPRSRISRWRLPRRGRCLRAPTASGASKWSAPARPGNIRATKRLGVEQGEGIVVGHPDTGYTRHLEIWSDDPRENRLRHRDGYDVWSGDDDATDPLDPGFLAIFGGSFVGNPGHGTGTSSVIFSSDGPYGQEHVTGTAPRALLIPFRTAPSVVVFKQWKLAEAIRRAADKGCHVISISMGGPALSSLEKAVRYAASKGVIVCAAAGNEVKFVVWPAAYDEVIACAGCNARMEVWSGSSRGKDVDITAPGQRRLARRSRQSAARAVGGRTGSGFSFAVATVAGIAASWLAHHGRQRLHRHLWPQ